MSAGSALLDLAIVVIAGYALIHIIPYVRRAPSAPSERAEIADYYELLRSSFPLDIFRELEIIVGPDALEFGWRSPDLDRARAERAIGRQGLWERLRSGLWQTISPDRISELRPRRIPSPHLLTERLRPLHGRGLFTGERNFRIRGVRTGIFIRTTEGKRYWLATRHPDQLIAAIEAIRGTNDSPSER